MAVFNPFDFFLEPEARKSPFIYEAALKKELGSVSGTEPPGPLLRNMSSRLIAPLMPPTISSSI